LHKKKTLKKPTVEQLKIIHYKIIENEGQDYLELPSGKESILESIINGVEQTFSGQELYPTICDKAIKLLIEIDSAQLFPDGNKRVALVTFEMFLNMNKSNISNHISQKMKEKFILSIATHSITNENAINCCIKALKN